MLCLISCAVVLWCGVVVAEGTTHAVQVSHMRDKGVHTPKTHKCNPETQIINLCDSYLSKIINSPKQVDRVTKWLTIRKHKLYHILIQYFLFHEDLMTNPYKETIINKQG